MPPAVTILPSPAMISVPGPMTMSTPGWMSGLPALPMAAMRPSLMADIRLHDAPMVEDQRVGDDGIDGAGRAGTLALAHAVADHLAAAELHLLAIDGEIALDLDEELGIGEANAVAGGRAEHMRHRRGAGCGWSSCRLVQRPGDLAAEALGDPCAHKGDEADLASSGRARSARRCRQECRAGSRAPLARSKESAGLVSKK